MAGANFLFWLQGFDCVSVKCLHGVFRDVFLGLRGQIIIKKQPIRLIGELPLEILGFRQFRLAGRFGAEFQVSQIGDRIIAALGFRDLSD